MELLEELLDDSLSLADTDADAVTDSLSGGGVILADSELDDGVGNSHQGAEDDDDSDKPKDKKTGRRKIKIEFIQDKSRRHITFSKRKAGASLFHFWPTRRMEG